MEILTKTKEGLKQLSDRELLETIQENGSAENLNYLQNQFFERFRGHVFKGANQRTRNFADSNDFAIDITQQTFISIFAYRKKIVFPPTASDKECTQIIKALLGRIANNHFNKEYAKRNEYKIDSLDDVIDLLPDMSFDLFESLYSDEIIEVPNGFKMKLQEALNSIKKERDKHIILEYAREGCLDTDEHLSQNKIDFLCKLYKTTSHNIRQVKKRTLDKIKLICFQT